jgi:hypothetical protein
MYFKYIKIHSYKFERYDMKNLFIIAGLSFLLGIFSCSKGLKESPCLEIPEIDPTPPELELIIKYKWDGKENSLTINQDDKAKTINADKNSPIYFTYSGQDLEGLKSVHFSLVVEKTLLGEKKKHDYSILPLTVNCPREEIKDSFKLSAEQGPRIVKAQLKGANWLDKRSMTKVITIEVK